jgi:outer membrane protein TolC
MRSIAIIWIAAFLPVAAQKTLSLEQAVAYALENQAKVKTTELDLKIGQAKIRENIATGLPQIDGSGGYTYNIQSPEFVFPDFINGNPNQFITIPAAPLNQASLGLSASMLLFNGQYFVGIATAKQFLELTRAQHEMTERDVRLQVTKSVYLVLMAQESVATLDSSLVLMEKTLNELRITQIQGFAELLDVQQLELMFNNTQNLRVQAANGQTLALAGLKYQMGWPLMQELTLAETLGDFVKPLEWESLVASLPDSISVQERREYDLISRQVVINDFQIKLQKAEALPTLSSSLNYQHNFFNSERFLLGSGTQRANGGLAFGMRLSVPIFSSWNRMYKLKQYQLEKKKTEIQRGDLGQALQLEYQSSSNAYKEAVLRYTTQQKNLNLAREVRRVNTIKFKEGLINSLTLTQIERQFYEAQQGYFQALFDVLSRKADVLKSMEKF